MKQAESKYDNRKIIDEKLKNGEISGFYFFFGEEDYMKDYYSRKLMESSAGQDASFDVFRFNEDNFNAKDFMNALTAYPVEGRYKFIELRGVTYTNLSIADKRDLTEALNADNPDLIIVAYQKKGFELKNMKKDPIQNILFDNSLPVEFPLNKEPELTKWLKKRFNASKLDINNSNASYLIAMTSREMYKLASEADKLIHYRLYKNDGGKVIEKDDIDFIVPKTVELVAFELANSIIENNIRQTLEIIFKSEYLKTEPTAMIGQIARVFYDLKLIQMVRKDFFDDNRLISNNTGIHEYRVKLYINALKSHRKPEEFIDGALTYLNKCDVLLKSTDIDEYALLYGFLYNLWVRK